MGCSYKYTVPSSQGAEFEILSFGADGTLGGDVTKTRTSSAGIWTCTNLVSIHSC